MPPTIDARNDFDQAKYSDITIKSGNREFKCHKIILASVSDDEPDAVEAILQYIYSFKYEELGAQKKTTKNTVLYHLGAYKAAQKYQMKELVEKVLKALHMVLKDDDTNVNQVKDTAESVSELVDLLADYKEYDAMFEGYSNALALRHLPALITSKGFRASILEEDEGEKLALVRMAMGAKPRKMVMACYDRNLVRRKEELEHYCVFRVRLVDSVDKCRVVALANVFDC